MQHFKTADCDKSVERQAYAAQNAGGNCFDKCDERAEKRDYNRDNSRADYGVNRGVFGDCHTADAFAVSGVGAAAEDCADGRSKAVTD